VHRAQQGGAGEAVVGEGGCHGVVDMDTAMCRGWCSQHLLVFLTDGPSGMVCLP
jgi:hypothetical protein